MADLSPVQLSAIIVGSGGIAGVVQAYLVPRLSHKNELSRMKEENRLLQVRRREEAHDAVRSTYAPMAGAVYRWIDSVLWDVSGPELSMFDPAGSAGVPASEAEMLEVLRQIWSEHPSRYVRTDAWRLWQDVSDFYCEPPPDGSEWPGWGDRETFFAFRTRARALVDEISDPYEPPDAGTSDDRESAY